MRLTLASLAFLVMVLVGFTSHAVEQAFIGIIKSVEGSAVIMRNGESIAIVPGMPVQEGDVVRTDGKGSVGLVFSDDTRLSLGPSTEIVVDTYLFDPLEKNLSFVLRLIRGAISFLSGQMTKLAPDSVQLVMPAATIGVRGTHVLARVD